MSTDVTMDVVETKVHESPYPGSRLMITEMVLENFKSYAGVKRIGPFHKCFSAVVGPNGSGKSNVIDAMLFVFGKRAKQLRLNKVSDLIHNSTENPNCEYAKVTVYFQNIIDKEAAFEGDDSFDVVDGSQLEVSRIAYQSNKSDYFIDGRKASFTEVETVLEKRGIDLQNNRFLILQGEVEQISLMKPKGATPHEEGLLEYLEDIIGSNRYVEDIEKASARVDELNQIRTETLNRVKVVEKEKESLEESKNEAEEYLEKDRVLMQKRGLLVQVKLATENAQLAKLQEDRTELESKIEEEQAQISGGSGEANQLKVALEACESEFDILSKQLADSKQQYAAFERKDVKFREELKHAQKTSKELHAEVKAEEKNHTKFNTAADKLRAQIPTEEQNLAALVTKKEALESKLDSIFEQAKNAADPLRVKLEEKQKSLPELNKEVMEAKNACDLLKAEIDIIRAPIENAEKLLQQAANDLEDTTAAIASRPQEIECCNQDMQNAEKQLATAKKQHAEAVDREKDLEQKVRESRQKFESGKASMASAAGRGEMINSLFEASKRKGTALNRVGGFHGRLGELGTIDSKYDVAVSTASSALNYLVTDSTKCAEACVEHLREKQLGRGTFAILEKLDHLRAQMNKPVNTPEGVPRLFDLVDVADEKFKPAFYFALRDTLVAEDLDQAVRIAYVDSKCVWRVVTLQGQLIDTSGTLAGGGNKQHRGSLRLKGSKKMANDEVGLVSKDEVDAMQREAEELAEELKGCREKRIQLSKDVNRLEAQISQLQSMIPKMEREVGAMQTKCDQLKSKMENLKPQCILPKSAATQLKSLEKDFAVAEQKFNKVNSVLEKLQAETKALQDEILASGGDKVAELKTEISTIEKSMEAGRRAINKINSDIKSQVAKSEKAKQNADKARAGIEETQAKIDSLQEEFKKIEQEALLVVQGIEEASQLVKDKQKVLESTRADYEASKSKANKIEKKLVDMRIKLSEYDEHSIPHQESIIVSLNKRFDQLQKSFKDLVQLQEELQLNTEEDMEEQEAHDESRAQNETLRVLPAEEAMEFDIVSVSSEIDRLESEVSKLKKNANLSSIKEYRAREKEYSSRVDELDLATKNRDEARDSCELLRKKRLTDFMTGFSIITLKLKEMYQMITLGGDAELELVDSCDPFSEGIVFSVRPPKKSWKNISNLSGGEKTLSSLALVFALHHYKPTPLYVMDEIDAALDFKNVSIVANYIKERTRNAQFIIISLRNNMFELADRLVGIYKTENATKCITINPSKIVMNVGLQKNYSQKEKRAPLKPIVN